MNPRLAVARIEPIPARPRLIGRFCLRTDLLDLPIEHWPYELLATRAWQLGHNLSSYDASYVALAELISTTLVTLDRRLAAAPGLHCPVRTP